MSHWITQRLQRSLQWSGTGVHSGEMCRVVLSSLPAKSGAWMQSQGERWPLLASSVLNLERCTVVGQGAARVSTVEHLLAALAAFQVYDCLIEVEGPEIPILDGSSLPFVEALESELIPGPPIHPWILDRPLWVGNEQSQVLALPSAHCRLHCCLHYPQAHLGYQEVSFEPLKQSFRSELAPARTFALEQEVAWLKQQGLAQGGSLDNALVVLEQGFSSPLRLPQEPARHKLLDLLGDLYLLGRPLQAQVWAIKAGHRWHIEWVRKLLEESQIHAKQR